MDKETSGLLVVAKTDRAHRLLSAAIAARRVVRRYAVMTWGHLTTDSITIDKPVARDPRDRKRMAIVNKGRPAKTDLIRLARFDAGDLLRAHLHSGRTHQIRVHLASIGHPVMGDDVYGGGGGRRVAGLPPKRHFLHAAWLAFNHPVTGKPLEKVSLLLDPLEQVGPTARDGMAHFSLTDKSARMLKVRNGNDTAFLPARFWQYDDGAWRKQNQSDSLRWFVFNDRGLQCVNLANGMIDIHTADERIAVADLEGMVDVTLALLDAALA